MVIRITRRRLCLLLAAALSAAACAQSPPAPKEPVACASAPPPYRFLRFAEDFEAFRNPVCQSGPWDALKYIALDDADERVLTLGGDVRLQLINARYLSFGNEGGDNDNVFIQRYHAHASLRLSRQMRLFAELKANHQQGREPGPLGADADQLDVHQAFIDVGTESASQVRLGRQELLYGSGRRIFPRNGPNVRGNFDALRWTGAVGDWRTDAFVFHPVAVDPGRFDDSSINEQSYAGVYASGLHAAVAPALIDAYYIALRREGARFAQGVADELRHTVGARLSGRRDAWDHDHELSLQWGRFGGGSIVAWALASETGHTWRDAAWQPRASLRVSVGSGDRDPANPDLQTFNSLLPRGGAVDEGFGVSAANMSHVRAALGLRLVPEVEATLALNTQWRTSRRDGVYGAGGGLIRGPGGSEARHIGDSVDVYVLWIFNRYAALDLTAGYFVSGRFVAESGPKRNMSYITPSLRLRF